MHPSPTELRQFANSGAEARAEYTEIGRHLVSCPQCREYVELIEEWNRGSQPVPAASPAAQVVAERAFAGAVDAASRAVPRIIELIPLASQSDPLPVRLAADGHPPPRADRPVDEGLEHAATLYAADPELVLRVMRDRRTGEELLHLIGTDPDLTSNVLIHIVEPSLDFMTDAQGVARLGPHRLQNPETLHWQVRLPEAVFALSPLQYNPEQPGAKREFELETDADNRIRVALESRTEGMMLHLTLLRIGGSENLQRARLVITQGPSGARTVEARGPATCTITGLSASEPIDIRVFAE
jgi:hypothetical protein